MDLLTTIGKLFWLAAEFFGLVGSRLSKTREEFRIS